MPIVTLKEAFLGAYLSAAALIAAEVAKLIPALTMPPDNTLRAKDLAALLEIRLSLGWPLFRALAYSTETVSTSNSSSLVIRTQWSTNTLSFCPSPPSTENNNPFWILVSKCLLIPSITIGGKPFLLAIFRIFSLFFSTSSLSSYSVAFHADVLILP